MFYVLSNFIIKKLRPKTIGRSVISALPPKLCIINTPLNFYGSYNLDQNKFQRIYKDYINDQIKSVSTIKDYNTLDSRTELLNKYPELDSYLYVDGLFNKLKESPYNSQTYQISILRGGYGFGP